MKATPSTFASPTPQEDSKLHQPFPKLSVEPRDCANQWDLSALWQTLVRIGTPSASTPAETNKKKRTGEPNTPNAL
jgi:hypothetical protein